MKEYSKEELASLREHVVNLNHIVSNDNVTGSIDLRKYGFSASEAQEYQLDKNDFREYINTWESYMPRLQDDKYFVVSDDKLLFSLVFGNYVEVLKTLATVTNGNLEPVSDADLSKYNIYDYALNNNGIVLKYRSGCDGFGIHIFVPKDGELYFKGNKISKDEVENYISNAKYCIIQNRMVQGDFENKIFDKTINTIRVISVRKKDSSEHEIIGALQRIGSMKSMPVDNFNQGGFSALIDVETGKLGKMTSHNLFDDKGERIFYSNHPDSGTRVEGLIIPGWNDIKAKISELSKKIPFYEYIAWDVVLKNDGIGLIEINMKSSLNLFQVHGE